MSLSLAALALAVLQPQHGDARELSALPRPGVHPRVFFTADEYPRMRARLSTQGFDEYFAPSQRHAIGQALASNDLAAPTDAQLLQHFRSDEGRNINWGVASLTAVLNDDAELRQRMMRVVTNYARVILAARERAKAPDLPAELEKRLSVWRHDRFDVNVSWTFGAAGYALSYDVLYPHMSVKERELVGRAIAAATAGRKSYGADMPRGFASSNHYGYHGDLAVMLAAIEDRPDVDRAAWDRIVQVLRDYWEIGFTSRGTPREDGYGPNLGLRAGSRGYVVLARRGYDIFKSARYRGFLNQFALDYDPYPGGQLNGGASGGPYAELYPTSTFVARYMYPESPVANFLLRHLVGESYDRRLRWQGRLDAMMFGAAWLGPVQRRDMLERTGLPRTSFDPERGKLCARSDWSSDAAYLILDARPDAHLIGHDKVDRGNVSFSALGRVWAFSGDFRAWDQSRENSHVHIDGRGQPWKAPSVRFLWHRDDGRIAGGAADLQNAYDWQWSPPWPRWGQKFDAPWEPETRTPKDLGCPDSLLPEELAGSIHGSDTGYAGRNNLHRRPWNPVRRAVRSAFLVRGDRPFALICDDVQKDDEEHLYEWILQLPTDLMIESTARNSVILAEPGVRRLLVQFLREEPREISVESYDAHRDRRTGNVTSGKRLIAAARSVEPNFCVALIPFREGDAPAIQLNGERLRVGSGPEATEFTLAPEPAGGVRLR